MVRKHTRRAAKAAFAVSIGVALLIGLTAGVASAGKSRATSSKPTITLGTKNFGEEYILGQLYGQALQAKGFTVHYQGELRILRARQRGDPEEQDELLSRSTRA